jgi:hypothetical protein
MDKSGILSFAESEISYYPAIPFYVLFPQIIEQIASPADHFQQTSTRVVVLFVFLEMAGQRIDALREQGYLYLRRACIAFMHTAFFDDSLFFLTGHCH